MRPIACAESYSGVSGFVALFVCYFPCFSRAGGLLCWVAIGQKTYFHLNHPIKWIRITGVVVSVDHYDKFGLAELDDSSGRTVELKYDLPEVKHRELDLGDGKDTAIIPTGNSEAMAKSEVPKSEPLEKPRPEDQIDHTLLEVGNVVCVKGTIRTYRNARQVDVIKLALVPSTTHELAQMRALLSFQATHLRAPWVVTAEEMATLKVAGSVAEKKRIAREVECRKLGLSEEQWREKRREEKESEESRKGPMFVYV